MHDDTQTGTEAGSERRGGWSETLRAVFWAGLLALLIRSFVIEPFKIPSGSMIATLLVGDYVLVNKFAYGLRLPVTGTLLWDLGEPERGDVMVFRYPDDPSQDFIKRVVGLPGDRVEIRGDHLFLNGQVVDQIPEGQSAYLDVPTSRERPVERYLERNPEGVEYTILRAPAGTSARRRAARNAAWTVPDGHYFTMGDNRDHSSDSREWRDSFVAADQIKGRAFAIHWSWVVAYGHQPERGFVGDLLYTLGRVVTWNVEEVRWGRIGRSLSGPAD